MQTAERFEELVDPMLGYLRAGVTYSESTGCGDLDVGHAVRLVVPDRVVYQVGGKPERSIKPLSDSWFSPRYSADV